MARSSSQLSSLARSHFSPFKPIIVGLAAIIAWDTPWEFLAVLSFVFVWALWTAKSRTDVALASFGYFAGALWPIVPSADSFFHRSFIGFPVYLAAVVLSAAPFVISAALLWGHAWGRIWVGIAIAWHAAFFGLASPLTAGAIVAAAVAPDPNMPDGWVAVDTDFGPDSRVSDYQKLKWMEDYALTHDGQFFVFPEGTIRQWVPGPWISDQLATAHKTIIFGALEPITASEWKNEVIFAGQYHVDYQQRIPLPVGMMGSGFKAAPFGPAVLKAGDRTVSVALCFEQVLPFALLEGLARHPQVMVAPANLGWARMVPEVDWTEERSVEAWSRLFGVPLIRSVNR